MAHVFDYVVIGSGISGLTIATALSKITDNVALVESADHIGGHNKKVTTPYGVINNGLRQVPASLSGEKALKFLEELTETAIIDSAQSASPITFEGGQFKSFLGFGDAPPAFYEELNYFIQTDTYNLSVEPHSWPELLFSKFKGQFFPRSYVTKFHAENEAVTHVTINGTKQIHGTNFIFTGTVKDLNLLLPEEALSHRVRAKLNKNAYWTALCLDLCHNHEVTDSKAVHLLNGTTQDEIGPCVGKFLPAITTEDGQTLQTSQWMTYVGHEETEDSEIVGAALKKIKRQIKRAYPNALDNIVHERIFVAPLVGGNGDLKLSANQTLPALQNLWIASGTMNDHKNLVGSLLQAELVLSQFGINPIANSTSIEISELDALS
ncbi:MAG: FAD-dependent oxidoreductase [Bdellovibrionia bacterium]